MNVRVKEFLRTHWLFLLSMPAYLWQAYFLFIPLLFIFAYSVMSFDTSTMITLRHYGALFTSTYAHIFYNSCLLSALTGGLCLLIAFPVAYYLAVRAKRLKNVLLVFLILPSWTSFIIQIYSWFYLLQKNGIFSSLLFSAGLTSEPINLLNCYGATILGMVYCYLPFMVFPLYTVLAKMDPRLLEASADLGASRLQTFWRVVLPLSWSGIKVGSLLVMIPAFGEFAIPDLMGGFKDVYVGRSIMEKFLLYRDWYSGAAVVMMAIVIPLLLSVGIYAVSRVRARFQATVTQRRGRHEPV